MRLRRNWKGEEALPGLPGVLQPDPALLREGWEAVFGRAAPIHVEIGSGKGGFLIASAERQPSIDFIGVERVLTIMHTAAVKNEKSPLPNLRFLPVQAERLEDFIHPGQIDRIYLNFSDPWPKNNHASRRLTARDKLRMYSRLLTPGGQIHFKTDQAHFFDYSLRVCVREGWSVGKITRDLYRSGMESNIPTEYEQRFVSLGLPIYRFEAWNAGYEW